MSQKKSKFKSKEEAIQAWECATVVYKTLRKNNPNVAKLIEEKFMTPLEKEILFGKLPHDPNFKSLEKLESEKVKKRIDKIKKYIETGTIK